MKKRKESKRDKEDKNFLIKSLAIIGLVMFGLVFITNVKADQITHKFKSPSFNGVNTSSHYLTIENQEFNRKQTIKDELKAAIEEANLFGETPSTSGTITLEGNTIEYTSDGTFLTLKITEADGTVTHITIPIGSFTF